ncbi:TPA: phage baseplate assembly protein V [Serratia fonticola]
MNDIAEILRRLANLIRFGTVESVQMDPPRVRIATGELVTTWIPWLALRAGSAVTWWAPTVGEQVVVLAASGELTTAVALLGLYGDSAPAPSDNPAVNLTRYPDGATFGYDPASSTGDITGVVDLRIDANGTLRISSKSMVFNAQDIAFNAQGIVFNADTAFNSKTSGTGLRINSDAIVNGEVTQGGGKMTSNGITVDRHGHSGVKAGGDISGDPV